MTPWPIILNELQYRDDNIYRTIFEADPVSRNERLVGLAVPERFGRMSNLDNAELVKSTALKLELIKRRMVVQSKSYDELSDMVRDKEKLLAHTPAIQPVSTKTWSASLPGSDTASILFTICQDA